MTLQFELEGRSGLWSPLTTKANTEARRRCHRSEIDGLRAIAVLCVVLFHAGFSFIGGGFLGVDVFFVISGFLITGKLIADLEAERFSLARFYDHRVRRILPASIFVIMVTTVLAMAVLSPAHLTRYARSLVANTLFVSNLEFWHEAGYFDASAALKPLLHTWSLSLEEQFYLIVPLGLLLAHRLRLPMLPFLAVGFVASFAATLHLEGVEPSAAFYLLPTRSWELLAGSLAACASRADVSLPSPLPTMLALAGLVLVVASAILGTPEAASPAWLAMAPVAGTALVLVFAEGDPLLSRILATRPMVFLGTISYSLYLWHQPMLVLPRHLFIGDVPLAVTLVLVALCVPLAWATTATVERWFRYDASPRMLYGFVIAGALAMLAVGGWLVARGGAMAFNQGYEQAPVHSELIEQDGRVCDSRQTDRCVFAVAGSTRTVYLVGDSHAGVLLPPLLARRKAEHFDLADFTVAGCPLSSRYYRRRWPTCSLANQQARMAALLAAEPGIIVLGAWMPGYLHNAQSDAKDRCADDMLIEADGFACGAAGRSADIERSFVADIGALVAHGHRVVIVAPVPMLRYDANDFEAKKRFLFGSADNAVSLAAYEARSAGALDIYRAAHAAYGDRVALQPITGALCPDGRCASRITGHLAYFDTSHLSPYGATRVTDRLLITMRALFEDRAVSR